MVAQDGVDERERVVVVIVVAANLAFAAETTERRER